MAPALFLQTADRPCRGFGRPVPGLRLAREPAPAVARDRVRTSMQRTICTLLAAVWLLLASPAWAQNRGFEVNRYQPTAAGEWSFAVDHPWYSSVRMVAVGITFNYSHNPLVLHVANQLGPNYSKTVILDHQLIAHLDVAASFLDRILISASLPTR